MSAQRLVEMLRWLNAQLPQDQQAIIRTTSDTWPVDWGSFPTRPSCNLPGVPVGQVADYRYSTDADDGLHAHAFEDGRIELHLDRVDGCGNPIGHGLADTEIVNGALAGLAIAGLAAIFTRNPAVALRLLGAGAVTGATLGAFVPRRKPVFYELAELISLRER